MCASNDPNNSVPEYHGSQNCFSAIVKTSIENRISGPLDYASTKICWTHPQSREKYVCSKLSTPASTRHIHWCNTKHWPVQTSSSSSPMVRSRAVLNAVDGVVFIALRPVHTFAVGISWKRQSPFSSRRWYFGWLDRRVYQREKCGQFPYSISEVINTVEWLKLRSQNKRIERNPVVIFVQL